MASGILGYSRCRDWANGSLLKLGQHFSDNVANGSFTIWLMSVY